jgi:hypothetical protein
MRRETVLDLQTKDLLTISEKLQDRPHFREPDFDHSGSQLAGHGRENRQFTVILITIVPFK